MLSLALTVLYLVLPATLNAEDARDSDADVESLSSTLNFFLQPLKTKPRPGEVELGRQLFFDARLSADRSISCASCHQPSKAWTDGLARAKGLRHQELKRNTPSLVNIFYSQSFFWDGRAKDLDELAMIPIQELREMGQDPLELVLKLKRIPGYARQFAEVYGLAGITPSNISKAISAFMKFGIRAQPAPIDRFYEDRSALGPSARRGLNLFVGKGRCNMCHLGPIFTDNNFHNIGLKPVPGLNDVGRYQFSKEERSWRAFKTPTLRNLGLTAPYMHDGSLDTLRDVVAFYDRGGDVKEKQDVLIKPLGLTPGEKEDLVAFLEALSAPSSPFQVPDLPAEGEPASALETPPKTGCLEDATIKSLTQNVAEGKFSPEETDLIRDSIRSPLARYYEYAAFLAGDPALCEEFQLPRTYYGIALSGNYACRLNYHKNSLAHALISKSPSLQDTCRRSLAATYHDVGAQSASVACSILEKNYRDPSLCSMISPRYISPHDKEQCEDQFAVFGACGNLSGALKKRCLALAAFDQAFKAGQPELCGDWGLCRALMKDRAASADRAADAIKKAVCAVMKGKSLP